MAVPAFPAASVATGSITILRHRSTDTTVIRAKGGSRHRLSDLSTSVTLEAGVEIPPQFGEPGGDFSF